MTSARDFVSNLAAKGRYHFTMDEAQAAFGGSVVAVRAVLRRLCHRGEIASPYRGFFVIVPPEYRNIRCLPPEQFIPHLMNHWRKPYYVALLSAAELHGAAHHRPQRFQVMMAKNRRSIECGEVRIQFVARHDLENTPLVEINTPRGRMRVSSPEATALEIVGYMDQCGGLDNVAAVLTELIEVVNDSKLLDAAQLCPIVWSQRLGYLLEVTNKKKLASVLEEHIREHSATIVPLVRTNPMKGAPRSERWKLAVNARVEPDL